VGSAVAGSRSRKQAAAQQQAAMETQVAQANLAAAEAQKEAAEAQKAAEEAKLSSSMSNLSVSATAAPAPATVNVSVAVPAGVGPGMQFQVNYSGQNYTITCPAGVVPGQQIQVALPAAPLVPVASAQPSYAPAYAPPPTVPATAPPPRRPTSGKDLFLEATSDTNETMYKLSKNHVVDENNPSIKSYGIISVYEGTKVKIIEGDLINGLGGALKDYVRVLVPAQGGKSGLVSKHVLVEDVQAPPQAIGAAAPPPAIF